MVAVDESASALEVGAEIARANGLIETDEMNAQMAASPADRQAQRAAVSAGLAEVSDKQAAWKDGLLAQAAVDMPVPRRLAEYDDSYTDRHHATQVGNIGRRTV